MVLPTNITLGWKGLPWTNTLAYQEHLQIMDVKSFKTLGPGAVTLSIMTVSITTRYAYAVRCHADLEDSANSNGPIVLRHPRKSRQVRVCRNKLECWSLSHFHPSIMFTGKAGPLRVGSKLCL
jgi:hypothetical protein